MADVNITIIATDKASQILTSLGNALGSLTGSVAKLTGGFIAYGDQVRELGDFVGTNSEQTSRMIQLADDAFVSFETLRMASKNLSEKGLQPTVENMAEMSEAFLKLQPGVARSNFLVDNFGRAGIQMAQVMQLGKEKILAMNAGIEAGLIIDEKKAAAIYKTKQALDAFNDRIEAMKYDTAEKLLGIFQDMPQPMQDAVLVLGMVGQSGLLNSLANLSILVGKMSEMGGVGAILTGIGTGAKAMAAGIYTALGPVGMLVGALGLLAVTLEKFGGPAWTTLQQIAALAGRGLFGDAAFIRGAQSSGMIGKATGGRVSAGHGYIVGERGPEPFIPDVPGTIIPNGASMGNTTLQLVYAPQFSTASQYEFEQAMKPAIENILRQRNGR